MAILAAVCTNMPEAKLSIIFLPMFTFTASNVRSSASSSGRGGGVSPTPTPPNFSVPLPPQALKAIVAMDAAGVVLGWRFFDHAAHLGGAMFGM